MCCSGSHAHDEIAQGYLRIFPDRASACSVLLLGESVGAELALGLVLVMAGVPR